MRMMIPVTAVRELRKLPEEDIPGRERYVQYQLWDRKQLLWEIYFDVWKLRRGERAEGNL